MRKKLIVLLVSTLLSVTFITSSAFAAHDNPKGGLCDNTYTSYEHVGFHSSYSIYPNQLSDGRNCMRTRLVYLHRITCSSCGHLFDSSAALDCSEAHSICPIYIENH